MNNQLQVTLQSRSQLISASVHYTRRWLCQQRRLGQRTTPRVAHFDSCAGSVTVAGVYSFTSFTLSKGSDSHYELHKYEQAGPRTTTTDSGNDHHFTMDQTGSGASGSFDDDEQASWTYYVHSTFTDGQPDLDYTSPPPTGFHFHHWGFIALASGESVITDTFGGSVGDG